jgi:hypothetical protein
MNKRQINNDKDFNDILERVNVLMKDIQLFSNNISSNSNNSNIVNNINNTTPNNSNKTSTFSFSKI